MTEPTVCRPAIRWPSIGAVADGAAALLNRLSRPAHSSRLDDSSEHMLRDVGMRRGHTGNVVPR